jgi:hypothetical protein
MAPPRPAPPAGPGRPSPVRRPRRSADRPINARTVRGTWLLVALPLLLAAFTVGRPQPLPPPAIPPAFDGTTAAALARELADNYPDRSPGAPDALGAAGWFAQQLRLYGFDPQVDSFRATVPGHGRAELRNVVAVRSGPSRGAIVFLAHRDNTGVSRGENDNASGTAALIELARAYAPIAGPSGVQARSAHTLVFVSTDGGAYGAIGAARFAEQSVYADDAVAVIVLDAIGGPSAPRLVLDGDRPQSPDTTLVRTAAVRVLEQTGQEPLRPTALRQLLDLGFPFTLREQGPLLARGVPALTLTTLPEGRHGKVEYDALNERRLSEVGRAVQGLLGSLDGGLELAEGTSSYLYLGRRTIRGWAIQLVLITALLPFVMGAVDLFARCRRRRIPLVPAVLGLRSRLGFWIYAGLLLLVAAKLGVFPEAEDGRPLPPGVAEPPLVGAAVLVTLLVAGWLVGRERLIPRRRVRVRETLAGYSVALLALGLLALVVVATNPFALVYLLPSLYAWLWLPQIYDRPPVLRLGLFLGGFAGPLLLVAGVARPYDLSFDAPWYVLSLVATGYTPWLTVALGFAWLAVAAQLAALAVGRYAPYPDVRDRPPGPLARLGKRATVRREAPDALELP